MKIDIQNLEGNWNWGKSLDEHTVSSVPIFGGNGELLGFDTTRTEVGEEMYKIKYSSEDNETKKRRIEKIAHEMNNVLLDVKTKYSKKHGIPLNIHCIIPIPPSKDRLFQPVPELAQKVAELSKISLDLSTLKKVKSTTQIKEIKDFSEREKILADAFEVEENAFEDKNVLLIDDLYRSGATLRAITNVIKNKGNAKNILVLTATKTRKNE